MSDLEMTVEAWSARDMTRLLADAAKELELAASRLREIAADVDHLARDKSATGRYLDYALEARKRVESHVHNAPLDRVVRTAVDADLDRASRNPAL